MPAASPARRSEAAADGLRLSTQDFERVRAHIHRHAGITLNATKRGMVYSRLSRRLRQLGERDFGRYLDRLEAVPEGTGEWQEFVNALTTNLTAFFREAHHFPILAAHIAGRVGAGPVKLWSCAASTGEEPYSMAMTAMKACASRTPPVSILASDIDTAVLSTARAGVYGFDAVARLDATLLKRHFLRGRNAHAGHVRVRDELRALTRFQPLNLLDRRWAIEPAFDAIFCRNVMIYFDQDTQYRVLKSLAARLKPDGLLFAGHSENFTHARDLFEPQGRTVYRRATASL